MHKMKYHPAADIFPMLNKKDLGGLADDILKHGLMQPIETYEGQIIDGRNRYEACLMRDVEPDFVEAKINDSAVDHVLSHNLHRRHLTESQRAMIGGRAKKAFEAEAKERKKRKPVDSVKENLPEQNGQSRDKAGEAVHVSGRSVDHASKVLEFGSDCLRLAVDSDEVSVSAAAKLSTLTKNQQDELLSSGVKITASVVDDFIARKIDDALDDVSVDEYDDDCEPTSKVTHQSIVDAPVEAEAEKPNEIGEAKKEILAVVNKHIEGKPKLFCFVIADFLEGVVRELRT